MLCRTLQLNQSQCLDARRGGIYLACLVEGVEVVGQLVDVLGDAVGCQLNQRVLQHLCEAHYVQCQRPLHSPLLLSVCGLSTESA